MTLRKKTWLAAALLVVAMFATILSDFLVSHHAGIHTTGT